MESKFAVILRLKDSFVLLILCAACAEATEPGASFDPYITFGDDKLIGSNKLSPDVTLHEPREAHTAQTRRRSPNGSAILQKMDLQGSESAAPGAAIECLFHSTSGDSGRIPCHAQSIGCATRLNLTADGGWRVWPFADHWQRHMCLNKTAANMALLGRCKCDTTGRSCVCSCAGSLCNSRQRLTSIAQEYADAVSAGGGTKGRLLPTWATAVLAMCAVVTALSMVGIMVAVLVEMRDKRRRHRRPTAPRNDEEREAYSDDAASGQTGLPDPDVTNTL